MSDVEALLRQIEDLARFPSVIGHTASIQELAHSIARQAPTPQIELLALQVAMPGSDVQMSKLLWKLREALNEAARS